MQYLKRKWSYISNLGISSDTDPITAFRWRLLNQCMVLIATVGIVATTILMQTPYGNADLALTGTISNGILLTGLYISSTGRYLLATHTTAIFITLNFTVGAFLRGGGMYNFYSYFPLMAFMHLLLSSKQVNRYMILFILTMISYALYENYWIAPFDQRGVDEIVILFSMLLFTYLILQFFKTQNKIYQNSIDNLVEELKESNADLEHFASAASHDLQEPLRTIGSFVDLLEEENEDKLDEESKQYMGFITDGVSRMSALINALLTYSRLGKAEMNLQSIDPKRIIEKIVFDLKLKIEETNAEIRTKLLPEMVKVEPNQITIVFYNLINNGIKFNKSSNPVVEINAEERDKDYLFSIKDNGIGIDPKNHAKIFEVFKRLHRKEEYKGTGIGLASVKRIIEKHKGEIWLESGVRGTTFFFTIPK